MACGGRGGKGESGTCFHHLQNTYEWLGVTHFPKSSVWPRRRGLSFHLQDGLQGDKGRGGQPWHHGQHRRLTGKWPALHTRSEKPSPQKVYLSEVVSREHREGPWVSRDIVHWVFS